jgi:hypothetical protein
MGARDLLDAGSRIETKRRPGLDGVRRLLLSWKGPSVDGQGLLPQVAEGARTGDQHSSEQALWNRQEREAESRVPRLSDRECPRQ